jgi:hypothetical protein
MDRVNEVERRRRTDRQARATASAAAMGGDAESARIEDVRIDDVQLLDASGAPTDFGVHREPLTIRIRYDAVRPVPRPVFGIALHSTSGVHLTGTNTKIDGVSTGTIHGAGHIDFRVEALQLTPGEYELTVAINDEFVQHDFDRREREWHIPVRPGNTLAPEGLMDLRGAWTVS